MHLIVSGFGSYGDVLPMVGLGAAMRARGHHVQAIVSPYFRAEVEGAGLELLPLGTAEDYSALVSHADLWHPHRGLKVVLGYAASCIRDVFRMLQSHCRTRDAVIAAHALDLASRIFHDKYGVALATVHFAPFALLTLYDTPHHVGAPTVSMGPRWLKAAQFWLADRWLVDPLVAPAINEFRAEQGLPPVSRIYSGWSQSPQLVLGMFPEWFGPIQPDWPRQTRLVGFPLWDSRPSAGLPIDAEEFLQAGGAPLVFAPGSANVRADAFFRTAVGVCERLERRGILATKYTDQLPESLPPTIKHFSFVPFSLLLPRAAALIHHGGIGTCAQGLASALPQIVTPLDYDQLDNGRRLKRLGVGEVVRRPQFTLRNVAMTLARLLESPHTAERARHWASLCNGPAALARACDLLEGLVARTPSGWPQARAHVTSIHGT